MRIKKLMVAVIAVTLLAIGILSNMNTTQVQAAKAQSVVFSEENVNLVVKPGVTNHIRLPIKAVGGMIEQADASITDKKDASPYTFTKATLTSGINDVLTDYILTTTTTYVDFDVAVKETAGIGVYPISLLVTGKEFSFSEGVYVLYELALDFNLSILEEKTPVQLTINKVTCKNPLLGATTELSFVVKNEGEITARNVYFNLNYDGTGITKNYTVKDIKVGDLASGNEKTITLPINILPSASVGEKTIIANFKYKNLDGEPLTDSYNIDFDVEKNENSPDLYIESVKYQGELILGGEFVLVATLSNLGASDSKEVYVSVDESNIGKEGFIKKYYTDIWVPNIKKGSRREVEIPLMVSKGATGGIKDLKINITYKDESGLFFTKTEIVYPEVLGVDAAEDPNILISGVQQYPTQPVAGEKLEISFDVENKSKVAITELRISTDALTTNNFIPVKSDPYQYIERLEGGAKIRVTIPFIVSDTIPEGVNNLGIKYNYAGSPSGEKIENIPIRGVINDAGSSSKPKLIVSSYTADTEELRAGSIFNFTFDLYNTNSSVAAQNITVTVTQADNVFTVTQGSNSFFINKIAAGETVSNTLELKVKSDASTKAYPLKITIEYEYDGAKPNPTTGEIGETKVEELNLQAVENSRPVIDYVNVYSFDGQVIVSNPAMLSFEFYNMGKSPLNNVIATVEGDFTASAGSMYFIGNVAEGASAYAEFEVIPNMEGLAKGVVKITFEDSNGEEVSFIKEFETNVMGAQVFDPGMGDGGVDVFNPSVPLAKKPIIPMWLFIIIQVIIFIIFIPITKKIIVNAYKAKLRKKEEEKY